MIIKKYTAHSEKEAQAKIEKELGPEAIILTSRPVKQTGIKGLFGSERVEVTAAIEEEELARFQKKPVMPQKEKIEEKKASGPSDQELKENLSQLKDLMHNFSSSKQLPSVKQEKKEVKTEGAHLTLSQNYPKDSGGKIPVESNSIPTGVHKESLSSTTYSPFGKNVTELGGQKSEIGKRKAKDMIDMSKRLIEKVGGGEESKISTPSSSYPSSFTPQKPITDERVEKKNVPLTRKEINYTSKEKVELGIEEIKDIIRQEMQQAQYGLKKEVERQSKEGKSHVDMSFLVSKGISRSIAWEVETTVNEQVEVGDFSQDSEARTQHLNCLKDTLAGKLRVGGPLRLIEGQCRFVALMGSTGVGKTTTLAKLASLYNNVMGKKVAIINLDHDKFGPPPISHFANDQQINCLEATSFSQLFALAEQVKDYDLVLIDTVGNNHYIEGEDLKVWERFSSQYSLSYYLTLSATTKDVDNYGCIQSFSVFPLEGLIFTKLDETLSWGSLVNICQKTKKPISYLSLGKKVPDDLILADGQKIAKQILLQHNQEAFTHLQRIANT